MSESTATATRGASRSTGRAAPAPRRSYLKPVLLGVALLVLLVLGVLSLPLVAAVVGDGGENWILPVALVLMALVGALVGRVVPTLGGAEASRRRGMVVGALLGLGAAVVGVVLFFLLISGLDGA